MGGRRVVWGGCRGGDREAAKAANGPRRMRQWGKWEGKMEEAGWKRLWNMGCPGLVKLLGFEEIQ